MTDQINDQISAFIDNELSADESALLVRRFERDSEARSRAMRYTLIGASLLGELLEPHPSVLRQRIASALSGNSTGNTAPSAPKAREPWTDRWARPLLGVGIAATVAVVAIGTLRSLNEASVTPSGLLFDVVPVQASDRAVDYVVPQVTSDERVEAPIRLTNYLMHHGEFASGLTRTSVNSNVLGGTTEPVVTEFSKPVPEEGLE